ncbi:ChaN family lipoprotein [Vibrio natriegens]|uniref:ChaN family lipoprotein n=1 Tax=Vibrio natriegens TaxID=691 RepID=UPI0021E8EC0F|nr:ChaN family lipoprotein [Vibrio natriegens]UYI46249.1 ChaN family lipoprotein [Vibrio natriegens]
MHFSILGLAFAIVLAGCASTPATTSTPSAPDVISFYDYKLHTPSGTPVSLTNLNPELLQADVIMIGEWHTHAGIHRFQTELLKQLSSEKRPVALSMEQFTRDKQDVLDEYLNGQIGEQTFIQQSNAWPNYESDYRPLIEFAKRADIAVIAANAPRKIVRCIGFNGVDYLDKLDSKQRGFVAATINTDDSQYKDKFMASMHHGKPEQTEKQYAAQMTWDETMAESIVDYLTRHPGTQIVHVAGKFHTEGGLGTATSILNRNSRLNVVVITPVTDITSDSSDYQLEVLAPPVRYVKDSNRMKAFSHLITRNTDLECE